MARRYVNPVRDPSWPSSSARAAAAWAVMTPLERERTIREFRAALLLAAEEPAGDPWEKAADDAQQAAREQQRHARHIRFEGGQVRVLNSAQRRDAAGAWDRLAAAARDLRLI